MSKRVKPWKRFYGEWNGKGELYPQRAAKILTELSAMLGNICDQIRTTDIVYNKKLLECYKKEEKANRAKILAETTQEYSDKMEARDTKEVVMEMIRSLKYYLRSREEEYREGK